MEEMIEISKSEYKDLLKSRDKLQALEGGGVDNWGGYSESLEDFIEQKMKESTNEYSRN